MRTLAIISTQAFSIVNFRGSLIKQLIADNVRVFALASDYDETTRQGVISLGATPIDITMARAGINPAKDLISLWQLFVVISKLKPDVTLSYFIKPVIFGSIAAWLAGVPRRVVMIEGLGYSFTKNSAFRRRALRWLVSKLYRISLKVVDVAIFLNQDDVCEFLADRLVVPKKIINLGGIGVNLRYWTATQSVSDPITFMLAARLLREKGVIEYIEAARIVKKRFPSTRFLLLGSTDVNPSSLSHNQLETWVNESLIEWPGHVSVKPWLEQTSVYVLPSYREGLPRSTQEAMAMSRPIITTDVPGCRETVVDGLNGFLVPARDSVALAEAMIKFVQQPELIDRMGKESRLLAAKRYDEKKKNITLQEILGLNRSLE